MNLQMLSAIAIIQLCICTKSKIHLNKIYILETRFTKSGELCVDFVFVTQISKCMKVKELEADNWLYNIIYRLLEFWK